MVKANLHIQTKPFCSENTNSLKIPPISRPVVKNPYQIKKAWDVIKIRD